VQVVGAVQSLKGNIQIEYATGEWSVDIAFVEHRIAVEVRRA
jgi:hypothetical protein